MCGIAGFTHRNHVPDPSRIEAAVRTIIHRGPDQQGVFRSNFASMGAARLKILDLESGNQPIASPDGDCTIVFNGEIYNHLEVRRELEALGHRFRSHCDTETVLHAFLQWDTDCFARFRGMFGVALWTESQRRLVLARDRTGIKPLYVARHGDDLYFGSELKAILAHPEIPRQLSLAGLDCYLALNYVPCPWTLVEGIEKLPPGSWLEWRDGTIRSAAYWQIPPQTPRRISMDAALEELDALLRQSVSEHLLSDVPLGVWLSGGMDSSTILHYAAQACPSRLKTLSISFRGRTFDETPYIRAAASHYGTDHSEFDLNPEENLTSAIEEFAYFSDEPTADAGALPVWYLSKMTKSQVTVALSGDAGDELFAGYLTYRADVLAARARWMPHSALRTALGVLRHWPVSDDKISLEYKMKRFVEGSLMTPERAHVYWNGTFEDAGKAGLVNRALPQSLSEVLAELRDRLPGSDGMAPYLQFDQRYYLPDDILMKVDRMSMAHAVEVRPPFLDHRIIEFAAGLPTSFKIQGSHQKVILKRLMRSKLPKSILTRAKTGFDIPVHDWFRGSLRPLLLETLAEGTAAHGRLFRKDAIDAVARRHLERKENLGYNLWGLLILFLWMKRWRIQTTPTYAPKPSLTESVLTSI
ncbi:MAG TPA: asparagine synthase (glutamine-hydrolyzing) [Candidatus Acidoferrales bacterium]